MAAHLGCGGTLACPVMSHTCPVMSHACPHIPCPILTTSAPAPDSLEVTPLGGHHLNIGSANHPLSGVSKLLEQLASHPAGELSFSAQQAVHVLDRLISDQICLVIEVIDRITRVVERVA